jgi:hypothetical protein
MATPTPFHCASGRPDFLGLRRGPRGRTEIVYDAGARQRTVLRVSDINPDEAALTEAMSQAIGEPRVFPALLAALRARAISVEVVVG